MTTILGSSRKELTLGVPLSELSRINPMRSPPGPPAATLRHRTRLPADDELRRVPWWPLLDAVEARQVAADMQVAEAEVGEFLCRIGRPATLWFGVVEGLLKMSNDSALGAPITFTGVPSGAWFGEGTLLKRESYRYNIEALRKSVVAGLPIATFDWLLERSIPFNRYLMNQLNERLGQFIAAREIDRMTDADTRVARSLGALFHPVLYPGVGELLRITQQAATWSACRGSASTRRCAPCRRAA
jgi:CRP/FNR family cyclic AMP-dependent transcriptional regulator